VDKEEARKSDAIRQSCMNVRAATDSGDTDEKCGSHRARCRLTSACTSVSSRTASLVSSSSAFSSTDRDASKNAPESATDTVAQTFVMRCPRDVASDTRCGSCPIVSTRRDVTLSLVSRGDGGHNRPGSGPPSFAQTPDDDAVPDAKSAHI
jgi:hypothetical protein